MATDKVISLLGFAIKAGNVVFGSDSIERCRKKKFLILFCHTLSDGTKEKLLRDNKGIPAAISRTLTVGEITHRPGCKALAVTDRQMAAAIMDYMNGSYQLVTEVK